MKERGLKALTPRQRRTCSLAWVDHMRHADIAKVQGVSHWATKKRVQRARRRLLAQGVTPPGDPRVSARPKASQLSLLDRYV